MTTKTDYTEEEWAQLLRAPLTAGLLVMVSDMGITSIGGETKGMLKGMIEQPVAEGAQELVSSLQQDIQASAENKEKMETPDVSGKDAAAVMGEMMQSLADAASLVDEKGTTEEATGYKQWLMGVAEATAEAGREGGFLGIGSVRVSDKEKAAMAQISQTLGLT